MDQDPFVSQVLYKFMGAEDYAKRSKPVPTFLPPITSSTDRRQIQCKYFVDD